MVGEEMMSSGRKPPPDPSYDVFISHQSEHKPWVEWLARALRACGRSVFLDIWNLVPGQNWVDGLYRGLERCRAAVLVATPEAVNSGWVRQEYASLQRRRQEDPGFRLVPIVFGDIPNLPFLADIQAVDFRDPARYREAIYLLLCGLDAQEPGPDLDLPSIPPPPSLRPPAASDMVPGEERFLQRIMARLSRPNAPPIMIVARGRRYQGPVIRALLERARATYGDRELLHIIPPYSEQVTHEAYFHELGRQCGCLQETPDATAFSARFDQHINGGGRLFLLVSGFENANETCRQELAGTLRALTEQHPEGLRVVLFGGQRLLEQKYGPGPGSFLNHVWMEEWPDPDLADVFAWQRQEFPRAHLDEARIRDLLRATDHHAGLVRYCLERWETEGGDPDWQKWSYTCPELWETWYGLARQDPVHLREYLARDTFGPVLSWPPDATIRRLYWADLLTRRGGRLTWRVEVIRQVGREVLG
jgi:hypothetical protein